MPPSATASPLLARFNELAAIAAVESLATALKASALDPYVKRYHRSRGAARERWLELAQVAQKQAEQLGSWSTAAAPKRRVKLPVAPRAGAAIDVSETANNV